MLSIGTVVMGVDDFHRAVAFWTRALDHVPRDELTGSDDVAVLIPRAGAGTATRLALSLSATPASRVDGDGYPDDQDFIVLADPEGNRFCVINTGRT